MIIITGGLMATDAAALLSSVASTNDAGQMLLASEAHIITYSLYHSTLYIYI